MNVLVSGCGVSPLAMFGEQNREDRRSKLQKSTPGTPRAAHSSKDWDGMLRENPRPRSWHVNRMCREDSAAGPRFHDDACHSRLEMERTLGYLSMKLRCGESERLQGPVAPLRCHVHFLC